MQRRCILARPEDAVVSLMSCAGGDAGGEEYGVEILFVLGRGNGPEDGGVSAGRDGVGVAEEGDLILGFGDAA